MRRPPSYFDAFAAPTTFIAIVSATVIACASPPPPKAPAAESTTQSTGADLAAPPDENACRVTCGGAKVVSSSDDSPDYTAQASANANQVLEAMHPDLVACYRARIAVNPKARAHMTVDVVIAPNGTVQTVQTTGGAQLGDATIACLIRHIKRGTFAPPHGGGTLRIHVPFTLVPLAQDETI